MIFLDNILSFNITMKNYEVKVFLLKFFLFSFFNNLKNIEFIKNLTFLYLKLKLK